jgi:hypothetical protein
MKPSWICSAVLFVLVAAGPARADTYIRQVLRTGPMAIAGQQMPGKTDTAVSWLSSGRAYQDHGDGTASLYIAADSAIYLIDHGRKSVFQLNLSQGFPFSALLNAQMGDTNAAGDTLSDEEQKAQEELAAQMSGLAEAMMKSSKVSVEATGEKKKFGSWEAEKYGVDISMGTMQSKGEIWATSAAPEAYHAFQRLAFSQLATSGGFQEVMKEVEKIKGITVYSKSTVSIMGMDVDVETELLEMKETEAPAGTYEIPKGYTLKSTD